MRIVIAWANLLLDLSTSDVPDLMCLIISQVEDVPKLWNEKMEK